jgi:hypothetical protein
MLSASGVGPETLEDAPEGTKPPVEPLSNPQKAVIEKIAKISFSDMDWTKIDFARYDFTSMSRTKPQAREARQVAMRLKAIVNSLNRATDALRAPRRNGDKISIHRKAMVLIAYELTPDHSVTRFVYNISRLSELRSAARRAQLISFEKTQKNYSRLRWTLLILTLASIFEAHGRKATASKWARSSEPLPSLFVRFVRAVGQTLPNDVYEDRISEAAISKIASDGLKLHRRIGRETGRNDSIC